MIIRRERLHQRLHETKRLTVISAPPGSGKTTLLCEWADEQKALWVSLSESDNTVECFWHTLIAALGENWLDLVRTSTMPTSPEAVVLTRLQELDPVCLVLDNYEVLTSPEVHRTVAFLLENLPGSSRLLISSRNAVKLPVARLRAQNQLLELRDLNFTLEETACFLQEIMELPLNAQEVQTLHAVTEGWVAGLQLAAAALQAECCDLSKTIAAFKGDHRYVADYLSEEIFQNQPPDVQTFLLQTSLLSHLKADLCDAVVGISSSQMILEKLEAANLLVVPLDDRRQQYRYHCLFADFLRDRLRRDSTVRTTDLHRRAALWFEKNGHIDEAIDHALLGDSMLAARLIKAHAPGRLARGEVYTVKRWMSALPDSVPCEDIELSLVYAWALAHSGEWDKATQYLNRIESADPAVKGEIAAVNSRIGAILGNWQKIISCGEYALQHLPENMLSLRADILLNLGHAYLDSGDTNRAWEAFADAYRLSRTAGNPRVEVFSAYFIGRVRQAQGRLHQAMEQYREALSLIDPTLPVTGILYLGIAEVFYQWNQQEETQYYLDKAIQLGAQGGEMKILVYGNILYARLLPYDAALEKLEQARRFVRWCDVQAWQARLWLANGKVHIAGYWLKDTASQTETLSETERLTQIRVLIAQRKLDTANALLDLLGERAKNEEKIGCLIEVLMLQSLAADSPQKAISYLQQALELAEPEGYVRLFVDEGRPMRQLLSQLPESSYHDRLLAAFGENIAELTENLSEREQEVLEHVAAGYSNKTIAERLFLTEGTVKWYLHNIYGKLDVQSRTQAVARAKSLNLLS